MCIRLETYSTRCTIKLDVAILRCNDVDCRSNLTIDSGLRTFRVDIQRTERKELDDFCRSCRMLRIVRDNPISYHLNEEFQRLRAEEVLSAAYSTKVIIDRLFRRLGKTPARRMAEIPDTLDGTVDGPSADPSVVSMMRFPMPQEIIQQTTFKILTRDLPNPNGDANLIFVNSIPTVDIKSLDEEDRTCYICLQHYGETAGEADQELPVRLPGCNHCFGYSCLLTTLRRGYTSCPLCRRPLT